jgi:hypothetical protein
MTDQPKHAAARRIPDFATREEEAAWWDAHDITDYLDELEPVTVRFAQNLGRPVVVRLDARDRAELRRRAAAMGIGASTLIRIWVKERLNAEAEADTRRG